MNQEKNYFRAALIGGLVTGFLSWVPIISAGNCICCLWVIAGGVLAAYFLSEPLQGDIGPSDGALAGLLSGIIGAVSCTILHAITFPFLGAALLHRQLEQMRRIPGLPLQFEQFMRNFTARGFLIKMAFLMLLGQLVIYSLFGTLGGLLGSSMFAKKRQQLPPAPPLPPPPPPVA